MTTNAERKAKYSNRFATGELSISDGGNQYWPNDKNIWVKQNEAAIAQRIYREFAEEQDSIGVLPRDVEIIHKMICHKTYRDTIDQYKPTYALFKDCLIDMVDGSRHEYTRDMYITATLPYDYTEREPQSFLVHLAEVLPNEDDRDVFISFMKYAMTPTTDHQVALVCVGNGRNGKSKLIEAFCDLFGQRATTFDIGSMKDSESYRMLPALQGKYLAYCSEVGGSYINVSQQNALKRMTTNDELKGRAAYKAECTWKNCTKFVFDCNKLPILQDSADDAFFRRFKIIEFTQRFTRGNEIKGLWKSIVRDEGAEIVSWLARYRPRWDCNVDEDATREKWLSVSDNIHGWLTERGITTIDRGEMSAQYSSYKNWCEAQGHPWLSMRRFRDRVAMYINTTDIHDEAAFERTLRECTRDEPTINDEVQSDE